jgi:hypothetical protein
VHDTRTTALLSLPLETDVLFCFPLFCPGSVTDKTMALVANLHEREQYL